MNRGSGDPVIDREIAKRASMRPRFMNRGSERGLCERVMAYIGFNEAPIHESGKWWCCSLRR